MIAEYSMEELEDMQTAIEEEIARRTSDSYLSEDECEDMGFRVGAELEQITSNCYLSDNEEWFN